MKAMILAAGRGERMRPLTDHTPKPLLPVAGKTLIELTILQLVGAGFSELVINHAHLGIQIEQHLGDGSRYDANIVYSSEGEALETAGGIINALPLLGAQPFLVINGDVATDYPFAKLLKATDKLAHLVLIDNPPHHLTGDFALEPNGYLSNREQDRLTFSGIGVYHPDLFLSTPPGKSKLAPILREAIDRNEVTGEYFPGFWMDVGTPQRRAELDDYLRIR